MGIDTGDVRRLINETLRPLGLWSSDAEELLVLTAATESNMGENLYQIGGGPALGIFQMEPSTESDIWGNYIRFNSDLYQRFKNVARGLSGNLVYQIMMARVYYLRDAKPIPSKDHMMDQARYYKRVWNTYLGKATAEVAYAKYMRFK